MKLLRTHVHPDARNFQGQSQFTRLSTRAIALNGSDILLLYTKRYDDLSLPGGGLDPGEDKVRGMLRELVEETGAQNIKNIQEFGIYEEYRPWYKPDYDIQHMLSYCYTCEVDKELGEVQYEDYEIKNGMEPVWINIFEAITKNEATLELSEKKGMSVERETFLLKTIVKEFNL
jgi:ADP-ribose pyrophosphatase YjhB (NUDIX family)